MPWLLPREIFSEPQLLVLRHWWFLCALGSSYCDSTWGGGGKPTSEGGCGCFGFFVSLSLSASTPFSFPHSGETMKGKPSPAVLHRHVSPWAPLLVMKPGSDLSAQLLLHSCCIPTAARAVDRMDAGCPHPSLPGVCPLSQPSPVRDDRKRAERTLFLKLLGSG